MTVVQICVGSSCHLKGSEELVKRIEAEIAAHGLEDEVLITGGFCLGKCNREGVTVKVDEDVFTGVTEQNFNEFFKERVLSKAKAGI